MNREITEQLKSELWCLETIVLHLFFLRTELNRERIHKIEDRINYLKEILAYRVSR